MKKQGLPLVLVSLLVSCAQNTDETSHPGIDADRVLLNGRLFTMDPNQPWVEAVAIKDGKYLYVGTSTEAESYVGDETRVVDLRNKMAMPGINDAHAHPTRGGIKALYECNFPFTATPEEVAATVAQCVADNPDAEWIRGGQWDSGFFDNYQIDSPRDFLDRISGDKAVLLNDDSNHNGWGNSKALEFGGITKDTPDPADGAYVRDPITGEPNGVLLESAEQILSDQLPDWSDEQYRHGTLEAIRIANQFGITGLKDANAMPKVLSAFKVLDENGTFTVHMATSLTTPYGHRSEILDYDKLDTLREQFSSEHVHTNHVKLYTDGVPTTSRTAAMLAPYASTPEGEEADFGMLHIQPNLLAEDLIELDKRGYTVKIHVAGDRAVRVALNAIEAARKANGNSGLKHELAHAGMIDESDIPRFAELGAVADLSPYLWHPSPLIENVILALGPRGEHYWPIKSLLDSNASVLAGSDWPAAVESLTPWVGVEAMVTRADPRGNFPGTLWAEQAISLNEALEIFTLKGAEALGLGDLTGSIALGKSADLIVLNQNLHDVDASAISNTKVEMTIFEGEIVYKHED